MNWTKKILIAMAALLCFSANADIVRIEQLSIDAEPSALTAPYISSSPSTRIYISTGTGRSVRAQIKDIDGLIVASRETLNVDYGDTFDVDSVTHYGAVFTFDNLDDGIYTVIVEHGNFNLDGDIITTTHSLLVDTAPPSISGEFSWESSSNAYWTTHTDGKLIISLAGARQAGFPVGLAGLSGYSHATFTSEFLDGPNAGEIHADNLPAQLTNDGRLIIGIGVDGSISTSYVPANTASQMRFTYRLFNRAGLSTERSVDLYVATKATQTKPQPYGVFTGEAVLLDGIPALSGFVPYTANMEVSSNPVRMIYRANRSHYYGGGGEADIYGGWVNGARSTSHVVHIDDNYLYFDVTGSTNGSKINESAFFIRDLASWRRHFFEHQLTLSDSIRPPVAKSISYYQQGADRWFSHPSSLTTYITKDNIATDSDFITKIRISADPRAYEQRFSYDFNRDGNRYRGNCIIQPDDTECEVDVNLPYPGPEISTYHNRHRILGIPNGLLSDELVSNWMYDGSPASVQESTIEHDPLLKTITFTLEKSFINRIWSNSQIRLVKLNAAPGSDPLQRINMPLIETVSQQLDGTQHNTYTFSYGSLPDGEYSFYAYVEDGFSSTSFRHKREHSILSVTALDQTPPVITTNITNTPITSLTDIRVMLNDSSEASISSMLITGGPDGISFALPHNLIALKQYRPQYIFINPTEDEPYTLTINAKDAAGNHSTSTEPFFYQPQFTRLPDTRLPAVASLLRNPEGVPNNILVTPQIRNSEGVVARGVHKVFFTLTPSAEADLNVNGQSVSPGQTISFDSNLSATNHRLRLEVFPVTGGQTTENDFQIHIPNIKVTLCPVGFTESGTKCIFLQFTPTTLVCPPSFALNGNRCETNINYEPITSCAEGYTLDGLVCKGSYTIPPVSTCPTGYGLLDESTCRRISTTKATPCQGSDVLEDGMCKSTEGQYTNTSLYCSGQDVSAGPHCENDICTIYNPTWNACEVVTPVSSNRECSSGTMVAGQCVVPHEYTLNASCPFGYNREGLNCTRLEIVEPIKSCDTGWDLSSTNCVRLEYAEFTSCPSSHALISGRCHHLQDVNITCPETFTWDGNSCSRVVVDSATPVCPQSYEWSGTTCRRQETEQATPICESTYTWDGDSCSRTITQTAAPVCQAGYTWNPALSTCQKPEFIERIAVCEDGQTSSGETCLEDVSQPAVITCTAGYTWNGTSCAQTQTSSATPQCQTGYSWSPTNSRCERTENTTATPVCPPGHVWSSSNSRCEQAQTQSATPVCPASYTWSVSNARCERPESQSATPSCASGYTWNGSTCTKSEAIVATPNCASGYSWNGSTCAKSESTGATPNCASGYSWNGSTCAKSESTPATPNCPSGYAWNGSTCAKSESTAATPNCPSGYAWNGSTCAKSESTAATPSCTSGYSWNGSTCAKTETAEATTACPSGFTLSYDGQNCTRVVDSGPLTCPSGTSLVANPFVGGYYCYVGNGCSDCIWSGTQPYTNTCPTGYTGRAGTGWVGSDPRRYYCSRTQSADYVCPSGWTRSGTTCSRTLTQSPTYSCPSGWTRSGSTCNRTLTQAPTYSCPSGWTRSGTTCNRTLTQAPSYSCPSGWTRSGSTCNRTLTQAPTYSCSPGWTRSGTTCSRTITQAPTYSCPSGWALSGTVCNRTLTQTPTYSCPSGWALSGTTCNRVGTAAPSSYTCPSGWSVSGSSCNRVISSAPSSYSCASGWTVSGTNCTRLLTAGPVSYSCSAGWTVSGSSCTRIITQPPVSITCDAGWTKIGTMCSITNTVTPGNYQCLAGWVLDGEFCTRTLSEPPASYSCPAGWSLSATLCNQIQTTEPASYSCQSGWSLSATECRRYVYTEIEAYICDAGWDLDGNACSMDDSVEETRSCNLSYSQMNEDICAKDQPDEFVGNCAAGWTPLATQCLYTHHQPFILSCNPGFELNSNQCSRTLTQPTSVACQVGDEMVEGICRNAVSTPAVSTCTSPFVKFEAQCRNRVEIDNFDQL